MDLPKIVSFLPYPEDYLLTYLTRNIDPSEFQFVGSQLPSKEEALELVKGAEIILHGPIEPYLSRDVLEAAGSLKFIMFMSVGYGQVDMEAAMEMGITVSNNPGWNSLAVAEFAVMAMLALLRRGHIGHFSAMKGEWDWQQYMAVIDRICELNGKTVGVLGLGSIGSKVAKIVSGFGCRVLYHKRSRLPEEEEKALGYEYASLDTLIEESDILTVHVPITDETAGMIGRDEIARMKDGAYLVNTARSGIVDEEALAEALREGKLHGAAIDVPRSPEDAPAFLKMFSGLENVFITPHISSATREAMERSRDQVSMNVRRYLDGEKPLFVVNGL